MVADYSSSPCPAGLKKSSVLSVSDEITASVLTRPILHDLQTALLPPQTLHTLAVAGGIAQNAGKAETGNFQGCLAH